MTALGRVSRVSPVQTAVKQTFKCADHGDNWLNPQQSRFEIFCPGTRLADGLNFADLLFGGVYDRVIEHETVTALSAIVEEYRPQIFL
jgi:hypothetical protein